MTTDFQAERNQARDWFKSLRDQIVAAFEVLEDSQTEGPFANQPPGRFEAVSYTHLTLPTIYSV